MQWANLNVIGGVFQETYASSGLKHFVMNHFAELSLASRTRKLGRVPHGNQCHGPRSLRNFQDFACLFFLERAHPARAQSNRVSGQVNVLYCSSGILYAVQCSASLTIPFGRTIFISANNNYNGSILYERLVERGFS
jgi:hypothetical protein